MGCLFQGFRIYYGYGTSQVRFLCAITDDNYLFKHLIVGLQLDGFNDGAVANGYFAFLVAFIAYRKDSVSGNLQLEVPSTSVMVPPCPPLILTVAPVKGSPCSSIT